LRGFALFGTEAVLRNKVTSPFAVTFAFFIYIIEEIWQCSHLIHGMIMAQRPFKTIIDIAIISIPGISPGG
jgi:hypothetical protein